MLKYAFLGTILMFLSIVATVMFYLGVHKPVNFSVGQMGPMHIFFKEHFGPYHKIAGVIDSAEYEFKKTSLPCPLTFGRFLDDPEVVAEDRLRSHGGCLSLGKNLTFNPNSIPQGYKHEIIEKRDYLIATFDGAPSVAPLKVYPKAKEWLTKHGYKMEKDVIEIYKILPDQTVLTKYLFKYATEE